MVQPQSELLPWEDGYGEEPQPIKTQLHTLIQTTAVVTPQAPSEDNLLKISFAQPDDKGKFPALPKSFSPMRMRNHLEQLAHTYLTTPGLIEGELTAEQKQQLTAAEVLIYQEILEASAPYAPQAKREFWLNRMLTPIPKRVETVNINGDVKDWRETFAEHKEHIHQSMMEARQIEDAKWAAIQILEPDEEGDKANGNVDSR